MAGVLAHPGGARTSLDSANFTERTLDSLYGRPLPPAPAASRTLIRVADASGCPVTVVVDQRDPDPSAPLGFWTALAVIDDRPAPVVADQEAHRRRWAAYLYWGNVAQFLSGPRGDGAQLAYQGLDDFDPATLAAAGGAGFLASYAPLGASGGAGLSPLELSLADTAAGTVASVASSASGPAREADVTWANVALLPAEVAALAHQLAALGVPEPADDQFGYEFGTEGWQAEIAWPDSQVAVIAEDPDTGEPVSEVAGDPDTDGPDSEAADCLAAYAAAGWDARLARDWPAQELAARIAGGN